MAEVLTMERNWLRDNSLTIALLALFAISIVGQALTGWDSNNQDRFQHGKVAIGLLEYIGGGEFVSTVFENWESEFLQMATYVVLTAYLFQRGSPESKNPDKQPRAKKAATTRERNAARRKVPGGEIGAWIYSKSLGLAMAALFVMSFLLHWIGSTRQAAEEAQDHGQEPPHLLDHLADSQFWFESFQNWQSEFLSTAVLIVLAIYLRQENSPESKKLSDPNSKTGS
jgi:hypothetical protein